MDPSNPFRSQRGNHASHGSPRVPQKPSLSLGRGWQLKNCFHPRENSSCFEFLFQYSPLHSSYVYIYMYLECGTNSTKRSHYGIISSVLYRLFIPFVILFDYFIPVLNPRTLNTPPLIHKLRRATIKRSTSVVFSFSLQEEEARKERYHCWDGRRVLKRERDTTRARFINAMSRRLTFFLR